MSVSLQSVYKGLHQLQDCKQYPARRARMARSPVTLTHEVALSGTSDPLPDGVLLAREECVSDAGSLARPSSAPGGRIRGEAPAQLAT
jgi:hypothetical protein